MVNLVGMQLFQIMILDSGILFTLNNTFFVVGKINPYELRKLMIYKNRERWKMEMRIMLTFSINHKS